MKIEESGHCWIASTADADVFLGLWGRYLKEDRAGGSSIWDDEHNLKIYKDYFDAYTTGSLLGLCALWCPEGSDGSRLPAKGVLLTGEDFQKTGWHDDWAEGMAKIWGIYVDPEYRGQGVDLKMEVTGLPFLQRHGFRGYESSVRVDNPMGEANWRKFRQLHAGKALEHRFVGLFEHEGEM